MGRYGIWNTSAKAWQFGICEETSAKAISALFRKIGDDARKWRFEARKLPEVKAQTGREERT